MNKVYKIVKNALGQNIAVSELAKSRSKIVSLVMAVMSLLIFSPQSYAYTILPTMSAQDCAKLGGQWVRKGEMGRSNHHCVRTSGSGSSNSSSVDMTRITILENSLGDLFSRSVTYNDTSKTRIDLQGNGGTIIAQLKDGWVNPNSTDAVNGKQLYEVKNIADEAKKNAETVKGIADDAKRTAETANNTASQAKQTADSNTTRINDLNSLAVKYDNTRKQQVTLAGSNGSKITNLAAGSITKNSKDAVNGGQIFDEITKLSDRITTNKNGIDGLDGRITTVETTITSLQNNGNGLVLDDKATKTVTVAKASDSTSVNIAGTQGDRILAGVKDATKNNEAVNKGQLDKSVQDLDGKITNIQTTVTNLQSNGNGLVLDDKATKTVTVAKASDSTSVNIAGTQGDRILVGVKDATKNNEAVNKGQLDKSVTTLDNKIKANKEGIDGLDGRITTVETTITSLQNNGHGLVLDDKATKTVTVAKASDSTSVNIAGTQGDRILAGVKDATKNNEAINKGQLDKSVTALDGKIKANKDGIDGLDGRIKANKDGIDSLDGEIKKITKFVGIPGKDGLDGTNGLVGPAGKDGLNGKDLTKQVNALRNGEAGSLVYTDEKGQRAVRHTDGKFYLVNAQGEADTSKAVVDENIKLSAVGTDGLTTSSILISNVADAKNKQDAVNKGQLDKSLQDIDGKITHIHTTITRLQNNGNGLVLDDKAAKTVTVAKDSDSTSVNIAGTQGDRILTGVKDATKNNEAVNKGQLDKSVTALNNKIKANKDGIDGLDSRIKANKDGIDGLDGRVTTVEADVKQAKDGIDGL